MLLVSPSTYIAAVMFLAFMGFIFAGILAEYTATPQDNSPAVAFFELFWVPVIFIVPLLTMKSISEERRLGTLETLLTTPISTTEVVLGKYGAAYFLYFCLWSATAGFFYILHRFTRVAADDVAQLDRMSQELHDAEETRDQAITYLQQREAELTNQIAQTEAELRAAMDGLRDARHEAEELRGYIERMNVG